MSFGLGEGLLSTIGYRQFLNIPGFTKLKDMYSGLNNILCVSAFVHHSSSHQLWQCGEVCTIAAVISCGGNVERCLFLLVAYTVTYHYCCCFGYD